ncbi:AI-2E family transporter [Psychroflexus salis]|nr:AI-2E family transporter [Psychroflexus salis]
MNKSTNYNFTKIISQPFYMRATFVLIGICLFFYVLNLLSNVLIPISFGLMFAILLNPVVNRLRRWKIPKIIAIFLSLLLALGIVIGLLSFIYTQVASFAEYGDQFKIRGTEIKDNLQLWVTDSLGFDKQAQSDALNNLVDKSKDYIGTFLDSILTLLTNILLVFIYIFMFLLYKPLFVNFFYEVFDDKQQDKVHSILESSKSAIQGYVVGLMLEMLVIAVLNSTAYLIIGLEYAVLLGIICAILNLIPYIGGIIGVSLPIVMYMLTGGDDLTTPVIIAAAYTGIQLFDNYFVVPKVVSSQVSINAFVAIVIVFFGGALWGISGMFLSILFVAILKIIFENVENLRPWSKILGDDLKAAEKRNIDEANEAKLIVGSNLNEEEATTKEEN